MARELDLGGSERQMALLARTLDRSQFEPIVGCFRPAGLRGRELEAAGVPIVHFPLRSFSSLGTAAVAWSLARFIRSRGIRLVHTFDYPLTVFAVPVTRYLTGAIAVSSQRSHRDLIPPGYRRLVRATDRQASAVVVNCEFVRRHVEDDERVPARKIQVCYNGIDLDAFSPGEQRRPPELASADAVIGTVCALRPEKALPDLLRAFARIRRYHVKLVIVGSGLEREALGALSVELGVASDCLFVPGTDQVATWLRAFDIFVLPSRSEALSNSLMEAMACGCCSVASNVGGNPEQIRNGETGLLFEPGYVSELAELLGSLLENGSLRRNLATAGAHWIRDHFSATASARRMGEIYRRLIECRGEPVC